MSKQTTDSENYHETETALNTVVDIDYEIWGGSVGTLLCPRCSEEYLHQEKIEVFNRSEDADTGNHTTIIRDTTTVCHDSLVGNPSARRQGLAIEFFCELCGIRSTLLIYQHKGNTFLKWRE